MDESVRRFSVGPESFSTKYHLILRQSPNKYDIFHKPHVREEKYMMYLNHGWYKSQLIYILITSNLCEYFRIFYRSPTLLTTIQWILKSDLKMNWFTQQLMLFNQIFQHMIQMGQTTILIQLVIPHQGIDIIALLIEGKLLMI